MTFEDFQISPFFSLASSEAIFKMSTYQRLHDWQRLKIIEALEWPTGTKMLVRGG